jgi:hypothetical protein
MLFISEVQPITMHSMAALYGIRGQKHTSRAADGAGIMYIGIAIAIGLDGLYQRWPQPFSLSFATTENQ